ncbi:MAG TPA: glycogen synthase GlgA [Candidatus Krumholzibacteria bacterium]|nr:glycogen synthase GlgA [Candidatus Krumholzibacteria bacterium]
MKEATSRPRVLWVSPEAAPYASTGGLAEVVGAMPRRLCAAGWEVEVLLPYYRAVKDGAYEPDFYDAKFLSIELAGHFYDAQLLSAMGDDGLKLHFLVCDELYDRGGIYAEKGFDYPDNHIRFAVLSKAACELAKRENFKILHLHDWTAALCAVLLATHYREDPELADVRVVQSIHNLAHPGCFKSHTLDELGLPRKLGLWNLLGHENEVSWLKGGILLADALHTVSPRYAKEILSPEEGRGMDALLRLRGDRLHGILNGLDYDEWNPASDPLIHSRYDRDHLAGKEKCKIQVMKNLGLTHQSQAPLIAFLGRMVPQKGLDLIYDVIPSLLSKGASVVIMGSGAAELEERGRKLAERFPGKMVVYLGFERTLARQVLAGADLVLMPSRFEPCGLTQMQAMRYGTIPVVHRVGGLADTVRGVTKASLLSERATGFVFNTESSRALSLCLNRALRFYRDRPVWTRLMRTAMKQDWSWENALPSYERLYRKLFEREPWRLSIELPRLGETKPTESAPFIDWGPKLPERYHQDRIRLMVQSPTQLYLYWEVAGDGIKLPLSLQLERDGESWTEGGEFSDLGDCWIAASPARHYRARLFDSSGRLLLQSNTVKTPRASASPNRDARWIEAEERRRRHLAAKRRQALSRGEEVPSYGLEDDLRGPAGSSHLRRVFKGVLR